MSAGGKSTNNHLMRFRYRGRIPFWMAQRNEIQIHFKTRVSVFDSSLEPPFTPGSCNSCYKLWQENEPFIIKGRNDDYEDIYCLSCYVKTENYMKYSIPDSTLKLGNYSSQSATNKSKINAILFPNLLDETVRYKQSISVTPLSERNKEQLIKLCQQRNIAPYDTQERTIKPIWDKQKVIQKLQTELQHYLYSQQVDLLIRGYCRISEQKEKLNIPLYLVNIVIRYYPIFIL